MREILNSGVTGLLVSHSMEQVRELCNKILWLDHGRQVCFGEDVELYCDAYEEFLMTGKCPVDEEEIIEAAEHFRAQTNKEKMNRKQRELAKINEMIDSFAEDPLNEAMEIIKAKRPELF
jgi:ABC-2 type transport system ATP-binding protein